MACLSKDCIDAYLKKLEGNIAEYMAIPVSQRSAEAVDAMLGCWERVKGLSDKADDEVNFTRDDAENWCKGMINFDGTKGGHWSIIETNNFRPSDIKDYVWNAVMNMAYSDYGSIAQKYGLDIPEFCASIARAFLYDDDANDPLTKTARYYHEIFRW